MAPPGRLSALTLPAAGPTVESPCRWAVGGRVWVRREAMRVAVTVDGATPEDVTFVQEAERLGADSVWVAEAWGYDALTPLAFLAALTSRIRLATGIAQLGSRSPALLGMSAL